MKVFDIETLRGPGEVQGGWDNPEEMGFGTAVVYDTDTDLFHMFGPPNFKAARRNCVEMLTGCQVLGFNSKRFDNRVLLGNGCGLNDSDWHDVDVMEEILCARWGVSSVKEAEEKFGNIKVHDGSCSLKRLCQRTLGRAMHQKTARGSKSPVMIQEGRWADVYAYNLHDVRLTWALWLFKERHGYVVCGQERVEVPRSPVKSLGQAGLPY